MKKQESDNNDILKDSTSDKREENNNSEEAYDFAKWVDEYIKDEPVEKEIVICDDDEMFESLHKELSRQVQEELDMQEETNPVNEKKRIPRAVKAAAIGAAFVLCIGILLIFTPFGRSFLWQSATDYAYGKVNYDDGSNVEAQEVEDDVEEDQSKLSPQVTNAPVQWDNSKKEDGARMEEGITNILLLGEEAIDSGSGRGRTDIMMIATMNTKEKTFKLTSLMRDMLVQIPGYKDNKLNAAYEIGGVPLLYKTIELNFDLKLDGYVLVGFDDFESVINKLGGVKVTLTSNEAHYLNTTNYISKPSYRKVVPGSQILNGNQALGYCRVRYIATGDHQINDFGRTSRQRIVLNAVFEQYKSKTLPELAMLLNDILPMITTDIKKDNFDTYLRTAMSMGLSDMQNLRLPADHTFDEGYVRKMAVLIPDIQENVKILHEFIFGSDKRQNN